jgi:choline monooxygenase
MFLSDTHLPQLLTPRHYRDPDCYDREIQAAFQPAWHMVGTTADLRDDGDFLKFPLLGREVLLWRGGDEFHCYLNVCPHRFCAITDACSGNAPERLRCQYHGWEFDHTGTTRKIPDAPSFKPLTKGAVGLIRYPVERVGQLLFVSLEQDPVPLQEFLGPAYDLAATRFSNEWKQVGVLQDECEGNWKQAVEITLEGYHVLTTHEKTLGQFPLPDEDLITHEYPDSSHAVFRADHNADPHKIYETQRRVARRCGWAPDLTWHHYHAYPHFGAVSSNGLSIAQCVHPVGVDRHINLYRIFRRRTRKRDLFTRGVAMFNGRSIAKLAMATLEEDRVTIAAHHRGMAMPETPRGGLVSRREERVFHFQKYVLNLLSPEDADETEASSGAGSLPASADRGGRAEHQNAATSVFAEL